MGQVRASMFVPAGYVKLEGATVDRSNYPRLVALADKYSLWTADTAANPGLFGKGNGSTTMVLPNWAGRMAQFAATAGGKVDAGAPNITGTIYPATNTSPNASIAVFEGVGALQSASTNQLPSLSFGSVNSSKGGISLNASKSNAIYGSSTTVQPPAINTFAIMRY